MNRIFKLFVLGTILAYVSARLRRRTAAGAHTEATPPIDVSPAAHASAPEFSGISAIDPEAIRDAHAEPALLSDQLPQPGKNLP